MQFGFRSIQENRDGLVEAKEVRLLCPHCSGVIYVKLRYPFTAVRRQKAIAEAALEHRRLCSGAPPEAQRVYRIDYPRSL